MQRAIIGRMSGIAVRLPLAAVLLFAATGSGHADPISGAIATFLISAGMAANLATAVGTFIVSTLVTTGRSSGLSYSAGVASDDDDAE